MNGGSEMSRVRLAVLLSLFALPSCRTLPTIDKGTCGNAVVDPGEDCDLFAPAGSLCRPPGRADACRYDCSAQPDGARPACPAGFGCGEDGICRRPSGAFETTPVSMAAAPLQLEAADLDNDKRQDLLVTEQTRVAVRYFGNQAVPEAELDIPISPGPPPAVAELSGDEFPDVVVDYSGGITVALGNAGRSLISTAYPSLEAPSGVSKAVFIPGRVLPPTSPGALVLAGFTGHSGSVLVRVSGNGLDLLGVTANSPDELAADVSVGDLDEDTARSPCDELLFPFKGADRLPEFKPCSRNSSGAVIVNKAGPAAPVLLPTGDTVIGPMTLLDLDGDGHLDLAVAVADASGHGINVAYGVGDGTFNSVKPVPPSQGDDVASRISDIGQATPLAIGDVDGDGLPDYVDNQGVYVASAAGFKTVGQADNEGFSEALIADLNGNGMPDVLAANAHQSGAIFFNGAGGGLLNRFDVPTEGPLSHLCTGDFDGDLLGDVAAVQSTSDGDLLSILFGNAYGAPDPPLREGLLQGVRHVAANRLPMNSIYATSSINTVSVEKGGTLAFALFSGRGDRVLRAAYGLFQIDKTLKSAAFNPLRVVTGQFDAKAHEDIAELAQKVPSQDEFRLWLTPMTGQADIQLSDPRFTDPLPSDVDWAASEMASGNLDGSGPDEVVLLAPLKDGPGSRGYVAQAADTGDGHYTFELGKPAPLLWRFEHTEGASVVPGDSGGGRIVVADVDADHHVNVVALAPSDGKKKGALVVFRGDGKAALGTAETVPDTPDGPATAFATLQTDRDSALELALLAGSRVYIADIGSDGRYHVAKSAAIDLAAAHIAGAGLIAAGDFDGDGVDDIAVGNATSVAVFRAVAGTH